VKVIKNFGINPNLATEKQTRNMMVAERDEKKLFRIKNRKDLEGSMPIEPAQVAAH
jgi:hypothetical protein